MMFLALGRTSKVVSHWILTAAPCALFHQSPHFRDEETEAQRSSDLPKQ